MIDFSRTHLSELSLDVTGLERLILPKTMESLALSGKARDGFKVEAHGSGRWIYLQLHGKVMHLDGLENVVTLSISEIQELSVADVLQCFPNLSTLKLFGAPGVLHDVRALTEFPSLESIRFFDLFDYSVDDFPEPNEFPALRGLDLDSLPAEVAGWARRTFKKVPHIELSVRNPRKPEWLQENLGNPLRHWEGRDGIPATTAKKASAAWRAAVKAIRKADGDAHIVDAIAAFLAVIQDLNQKRHFIDTLERDEVVEAVDALADTLSSKGQEKVDSMFDEVFDA